MRLTRKEGAVLAVSIGLLALRHMIFDYWRREDRVGKWFAD